MKRASHTCETMCIKPRNHRLSRMSLGNVTESVHLEHGAAERKCRWQILNDIVSLLASLVVTVRVLSVSTESNFPLELIFFNLPGLWLDMPSSGNRTVIF